MNLINLHPGMDDHQISIARNYLEGPRGALSFETMPVRGAARVLTVLEDDRRFFPDYALTPVVREETLTANPDLAEQMNALSALLDDETMAGLNARVDVERATIEDVAESFLEDNELL